MGTMTPAQRRALYESARFARETTYNGPLGPEYTPAGTRLRLWAPTAEQAAVKIPVDRILAEIAEIRRT